MSREPLTSTRLAELDAISRSRELTVAEQRECRWLACQQRWNAKKRQRYASDPAFRQLQRARVAASKARA